MMLVYPMWRLLYATQSKPDLNWKKSQPTHPDKDKAQVEEKTESMGAAGQKWLVRLQ